MSDGFCRTCVFVVLDYSSLSTLSGGMVLIQLCPSNTTRGPRSTRMNFFAAPAKGLRCHSGQQPVSSHHRRYVAEPIKAKATTFIEVKCYMTFVRNYTCKTSSHCRDVSCKSTIQYNKQRGLHLINKCNGQRCHHHSNAAQKMPFEDPRLIDAILVNEPLRSMVDLSH